MALHSLFQGSRSLHGCFPCHPPPAWVPYALPLLALPLLCLPSQAAEGDNLRFSNTLFADCANQNRTTIVGGTVPPGSDCQNPVAGSSTSNIIGTFTRPKTAFDANNPSNPSNIYTANITALIYYQTPSKNSPGTPDTPCAGNSCFNPYRMTFTNVVWIPAASEMVFFNPNTLRKLDLTVVGDVLGGASSFAFQTTGVNYGNTNNLCNDYGTSLADLTSNCTGGEKNRVEMEFLVGGLIDPDAPPPNPSVPGGLPLLLPPIALRFSRQLRKRIAATRQQR